VVLSRNASWRGIGFCHCDHCKEGWIGAVRLVQSHQRTPFRKDSRPALRVQNLRVDLNPLASFFWEGFRIPFSAFGKFRTGRAIFFSANPSNRRRRSGVHRNKLRIPLEGTYSWEREMWQNFRVVPVLRSNYRTASLGASVGSPPGPQLARSGPLCLVTFCLSEARPFPPLPSCTPLYLLCTGVGMRLCH
jgi:hypothetical protein